MVVVGDKVKEACVAVAGVSTLLAADTTEPRHFQVPLSTGLERAGLS